MISWIHVAAVGAIVLGWFLGKKLGTYYRGLREYRVYTYSAQVFRTMRGPTGARLTWTDLLQGPNPLQPEAVFDSETMAANYLDDQIQMNPQNSLLGRIYRGKKLLYVVLPNVIACCKIDEI